MNSDRPAARSSEPESWNRPEFLLDTEIISCELIPRGSNYTFLVELRNGSSETSLGVYKPASGERPLWDFPHGSLGARERGAFLLSEALGWGFVPTTVLRDGPHGPGSVQVFVPHDPRQHYFTFKDEHELQCQQICAFDWLANNADRKAGHCLRSPSDRIWGIDNGLTFHPRHKLRTVIWDFAAEPMPAPILADLEEFAGRLDRLDGEELAELAELLDPDEVAALRARLARILQRRHFPDTHEGGVPWPYI
jgi:uncharacterized repeat protein (TIGR03843 family)